jgi:hypothetical protein
VNVHYLESMSRELARVGIDGRLRRRILAELADHLACDPGAELGAASALARQFADELGTSRARVAAFRAFGALAFAGVLFAVAIASAAELGGVGRVNVSPAETALILACILAGQVAFVAGGLGLLRALRFRHDTVVCTEEAAVLARRAGTGLAAGAVTMLALPAIALGAPHSLSSAWRVYAFAAAGAGICAMLLAAPAVVAAVRVRPQVDGRAEDLLSDLGSLLPTPPEGSPWRFALLVALTLAIATAAAGVAGNDPYDGALRGLFEAGGCLVGFATLGRYLGLRARD